LKALENQVFLGVEDGSFDAFTRNGKVLLCFTFMKENKLLDLHFSWIKIDGLDATEKLLSILNEYETDIVILGGVSYAGFNLIDAHRVYEITSIPVIVFSGKKPNMLSVERALRRNFNDWKKRLEIIKKLGQIYSFKSKKNWPSIYFEAVGINESDCEKILIYTADLCRIPEPVRIAGLIAKGIT